MSDRYKRLKNIKIAEPCDRSCAGAVGVVKPAQIFERVDRDNDDTISTSEFRPHFLETIDVADANADGEVTSQGAPCAPEAATKPRVRGAHGVPYGYFVQVADTATLFAP